MFCAVVLQYWEQHYKVYFHPIVCKPIFLPIFYLFSLNRSQCEPGAHQRSRDARSFQAQRGQVRYCSFSPFFLYHLASVILQLLMFSFFAIIFADFPVCRAPSAAVKQENKTKHYVCMSNGQIVAGNKMERHHFLCFWCPLSFLSLRLPLSLCLSLSQAPCADTQELLMLKCGITSAKAGITLKGCP